MSLSAPRSGSVLMEVVSLWYDLSSNSLHYGREQSFNLMRVMLGKCFQCLGLISRNWTPLSLSPLLEAAHSRAAHFLCLQKHLEQLGSPSHIFSIFMPPEWFSREALNLTSQEKTHICQNQSQQGAEFILRQQVGQKVLFLHNQFCKSSLPPPPCFHLLLCPGVSEYKGF